MSKCIVTGGAGFIGSHLTDQLIADGHGVVVIDNLLLGKKEFINPQAHFEHVDIRDYARVKEITVGADVIFHLAADPRLPLSIEDPLTTHEINVTGTLNILMSAKENGVSKVIFSSSAATYGDIPSPIKETDVQHPLNPYGLHKKMGEEYCEVFSSLYGLSTVVLRYFNVFGPRKTAGGSYPMVIPAFLQQRIEGKELTIVGDGEQTRDYVHVYDVVRANILAWKSDIKSGEPINIASGLQTSVNTIAQLIGGETTHIPERKGEMRFIQADISKAKQLLNWQPTVKLEDGIAELKKEMGIV